MWPVPKQLQRKGAEGAGVPTRLDSTEVAPMASTDTHREVRNEGTKKNDTRDNTATTPQAQGTIFQDNHSPH